MSELSNQDNWDAHWSDYSDAVGCNPAQKYRHRLMLDLLGEQCGFSEGKLLDIGSGQGDFARLAAARWPKASILGFEMSDVGVQISRKKVPSAIFLPVDLFAPPAEAVSFHEWATCATCSEVLEHVDDPVAFVKAASAYLKPGASLVVTVPGGPMSLFDKYIGHRTHFSRESITRVLTDGGLQVQRTYLSGFPFFNLYRGVVIARGSALIDDVRGGEPPVGSLAHTVMSLFDRLFRFNLRNTTAGWQVVAVATKV
ncbi:MAG: class I SAM-dependent methyltransferase [Verrucomicrobiota bacterium]